MPQDHELFAKPWYAYPLRGAFTPEDSPVLQYQIRDAKHNILFVSASYGRHGGAPVGDQMLKAVTVLLEGVNNEN